MVRLILEDILFALAVVAGVLAVMSLQTPRGGVRRDGAAEPPNVPPDPGKTAGGLLEPEPPPSRELDSLAAVAAKPGTALIRRRRRRAF